MERVLYLVGKLQKNVGIHKHSCLTAVSFLPPPLNMLVLQENVSPVFPQKQKAQSIFAKPLIL
jgi:hypothetical protein